MHTSFEDDVPGLMELRWFAMNRAAGELKDECDALAEVFEMVRAEWLGARARLQELEATRDALGDELARLDASRRAAPFCPVPAMGSAA
jgi:hypothetical protein